jgi:hypothetical protein
LAVYILTNKLLYCKHSELLKINYCFYWSAIIVGFFFDFTRQVGKSQKLFALLDSRLFKGLGSFKLLICYNQSRRAH